MEQPKKILVKKEIAPEVIKTEQDTVKKKVMVKVMTPQEKRAEIQKIAQQKREDIIRKKDSIINRNLSATGLTREEYQAKQVANAKKADCKVDGLQVDGANKRGESKGSCSTGQSNKGESLKDNK
jgi:hypothetical protein